MVLRKRLSLKQCLLVVLQTSVPLLLSAQDELLNFAPLGSIVGYSSQQGGNPALRLVDDDIDTRWSAYGFPQWAELDLGANRMINAVEVHTFYSRDYQYIIESRPDGGSYSTLVDRSDNTQNAPLYDSFSPVSARFIKLTVTGADDYSDIWVSITEMKVLGTESPRPAAPADFQTHTVQDTSISLSWSDLSQDETGFEIEREQMDGTRVILSTSPNTTTYTDEGLSADQRYLYRLRAISATNQSGWLPSIEVYTRTPFEAWANEFVSDAEQRSGNADPDGDGLPNTLERAYGLSPVVPDTHGRPEAHYQGDNPIFNYWKNEALTDLSFRPEFSTDLSDWQGGETQAIETVVDTAGSRQYVQVTPMLHNPTERLFWKLVVDSVFDEPADTTVSEQTVGGGTLQSPAVGPPPAYHYEGAEGFILVKNWDFGSNGTIRDYADMNTHFQYHDQFGTIANGTNYGALIVAPDTDNALTNLPWGIGDQPIEGVNTDGPVRQFFRSTMRTYLKPLDGALLLNPQQHNVGNGSFQAKWTLPNGGSLLGLDLLWETRVRYVPPPYFWFALWTAGNKWNNGAEMDLVESFGYNNGNGYTNYDGRYWHSSVVGGTSETNYHSNWGNAMQHYGITDFDASQWHTWTWAYYSDNTFVSYIDGIPVQRGTAFWTNGSTSSGEPIDMSFIFDAGWGHRQVSSVNHTLPAGAMDGKFFEWDYSRVYLRQP